MLNYIWLGLVLLSVLLGGCNGTMKAVTDGALDGAKTAVMSVALPLVGVMAIWLGVMRLAERSGLVELLARALRPLLRILFPDVPPEHPAMGAMVMNIAANMLGLGNAATPLGLRAMTLLEKLNPVPGTATNAMCTFLAINTSSVQLIPISAIAILAARGSKDSTAIVGSALLATSCACLSGVLVAKFLEKLPLFALPRAGTKLSRPDKIRREEEATATNIPLVAKTAAPAVAAPVTTAAQATTDLEEAPTTAPPMAPYGPLVLGLFAVLTLALTLVEAFSDARLLSDPAAVGMLHRPVLRFIHAVSLVALPLILAFFPLYASLRGLKVFEEFVEGAKESFPVALRIIPFLVAMLVAIKMFVGSGGMEMLTNFTRPALAAVGFPADLLPMVLMRPLSGSGTQGLFVDLVTRFGPDSFIVRTAGTIYGSTETTFYVLAVYFGSVMVRRTRHAVLAGLTADAVGVVMSIVVCRLLFPR